MIDAATQFKKMGYSDNSSLKLAETATLFQNIADTEISAGESAAFINSQLKAFGSELSNLGDKGTQAMHVIDGVNEVANNFSVGSNDLQLALTKAGSAMGTLGNSWEQTIGLVTAGTEIMVGQPSKVGRGLRTIGINIANMSKETDTWTAANGKLSVSLKDQNSDVRSTYDIMADVAGQWDKLSKSEQNAVATTAAGKNQYEVFTSIMKNFKSAQEATQTAIDSNGSAMKENGKYMDSIEGKLEALSSAWSRFSNAMLDADWLKGGLDILTKFIDFLASDTGQAIIKLTLLSAGIGGIAKIAPKLVGSLKLAKGGLGNLAAGFSLVRGAGIKAVPEVAAMATGIEGLSAVLASPITLIGGLVAGVGLLAYAAKKYGSSSQRESKKAKEDLQKTNKDIKDLTDEYKKKSDRIGELREKAKSDKGLTDAESIELSLLESETDELKKQIELKKELKAQQTDKKWQTVSTDDLNRSGKGQVARKVHTQHMSEEQAMSSLGINNKVDAITFNAKSEAESVRKLTDAYQSAMDKRDKMYNKYGASSEQYKKANEEAGQALDAYQKKVGKGNDNYDAMNKQLEKLKTKRDNLYKEYGGKDLFNKNAPKDIKKSAKELQHLIDVGANMRDMHKGTESWEHGLIDIQKSAKGVGKSFGVVSKDGKKINSINFNKFQSSMKAAGYSADDIWQMLKNIKKENPKVKIKAEGGKEIKDIDKDIKSVTDKTKSEKVLKVKTKKTDSGKGNNITQKVTTKASIVGNASSKAKSISTAISSIPKNNRVRVSLTGGAKAKADNIRAAVNNIPKHRSVTVTVTEKKSHKASGTRNFQSYAKGTGNAEVNEQGFEIIQDRRTGLMRVANGGYRGLTLLSNGDIVYTHGQSMRMLAQAGLTEASLLQGKKDDTSVFGVQKLRGFKGGGGLTKKAYNKKRDALRDDYDKAVSKAQYEQERYHYSDKWLAKQMKKARETYLNKLATLNKSKKKGKYDQSTDLSTDQSREYHLKWASVWHDQAQEDIEAQTEELKSGRKTYAELAKLYKQYLNDKKISAEEYADFMKDLNEKEVERVKDNYSHQWDYVSQYIQRQIDLEEKDNELAEAKNDLLNAQTQKVKIYREGQGFVYEQDAEAVKEAQDNLKSYSSVWSELNDYMQEVESQVSLRQAGVLAGDVLTSIVGGGLNFESWKQLINTLGANKGAFDLASDLGITDKSNITSNPNFNNMNIENIVLPNVSSATDFYNELKLLATQSIQSASVRG